MRLIPRLVAAAAVLAALATPALAADAKPTRGLRFPTLTPDGKTVVFAWRGDIWRAPTAGGTATRLTIHEAQDTKPRESASPQTARRPYKERMSNSKPMPHHFHFVRDVGLPHPS